MQQLDWQQRFEARLAGHLTGATPPTTFRTFVACGERRSGWLKRVRPIARVILTACYFHDIVSLPKTIPSAAAPR